MCSIGDACVGLLHYQVPMTVGDYFYETTGRYFLGIIILPLGGRNLHYGCIYLIWDGFCDKMSGSDGRYASVLLCCDNKITEIITNAILYHIKSKLPW